MADHELDIQTTDLIDMPVAQDRKLLLPAVAYRQEEIGFETVMTPYEAFLANSTQKSRLAGLLTGILNHVHVPENFLLDIGAGDADLWKRMKKIGYDASRFRVTLLEPNAHFAEILRESTGEFSAVGGTDVVEEYWQEFEPPRKYDVIIASHLYHMKPEEFRAEYQKMIDSLKEGGILVYVRWVHDDLITFKEAFAEHVQDPGSVTVSFDEALKTFEEIAAEDDSITISRYLLDSELRFPQHNPFTEMRIIEFCLDRKFDTLDAMTQQQIWIYLAERSYKFDLMEGVAVIRKDNTVEPTATIFTSPSHTM